MRPKDLRNVLYLYSLKETLRLHSLWLAGDPNGVRADLSGTNLRGVNLRGVNLSGTNLSGTNLSGTNLSGTNLSGTNLRGADLSGTNLSGTNLSGTNLRGVNLSGTNLRRANLRWTNLSGTNLRGADLTGTNLRGADLVGADLTGTNLRGAIGNMREIRSAQFDKWPVVWSADTLAIGCEQHAIVEWEAFDDQRISSMGPAALGWWTKYKKIIFTLINESKGA